MTEALAAKSGFQHISRDSVGSTNDEAMALAASGATLPLWVTADRQLRGRGRQGAHWTSEPGNLYASLALRLGSVRHLSQLPLVAAVALHDALSACVENMSGRLAIKWPNDILLDGRKVSGILAESQIGADKAVFAVVGLGVNLAHHPSSTRHPATNLAAEGYSLEPTALFVALDRTMSERLAQWQGGEDDGFQPIRNAWLDRVSGLGSRIEVRLPGETLTGRFDGMDETGRLVLNRPGQPDRLVSAGEVFFADDRPTHGNN
jgi:BirA family biotin operon repressor/biotin-[acetyl-CoA-carboxylase] ligase